MALEKPTNTPGAEEARQATDRDPSPIRRRLVKGAFAAPMILTLHSGGAMARSSFGATIAEVPAEGTDTTCFTGGFVDASDPSCIDWLAPSEDPTKIGLKCDLGTDFGATPITVELDNQQPPRDNCSTSGGFYVTASAGCSLVPGGPQC